MITEDYCNFEVAKLLKEKGFEIDTNKDYWKIGEDGTMYFMSSIGAYTSNPNDEYAFYRPENSYPCPTHQMAMKWLREEKNIIVNVWYNGVDWSAEYYNNEDENFYLIADYLCNSYEDVVEVALKYVLENLI